MVANYRFRIAGAHCHRLGLFREAHGGTLFIDELGELPIDSQAKLLRAIETRLIRPVGESRELPADVRIVAATNRDLGVEVNRGRFREDLYYRLAVARVHVPPLRERKDDLPLLIEHILTTTPGGTPSSIVSSSWRSQYCWYPTRRLCEPVT